MSSTLPKTPDAYPGKITLPRVNAWRLSPENWAELVAHPDSTPDDLLATYDKRVPKWAAAFQTVSPKDWVLALQRFDTMAWKDAILSRAAAQMETVLSSCGTHDQPGEIAPLSQTVRLLLDEGAVMGPLLTRVVDIMFSNEVADNDAGLMKLALMDVASPVSPADVLAAMDDYAGLDFDEARLEIIRLAANEDPRFAPGSKLGCRLGRWFFNKGGAVKREHVCDSDRNVAQKYLPELDRLIDASYTSRFHRFEAVGYFKSDLAFGIPYAMQMALRRMSEATTDWIKTDDMLAIIPEILEIKETVRPIEHNATYQSLRDCLHRMGKTLQDGSQWGLCVALRPQWEEPAKAWEAMGLSGVDKIRAGLELEEARLVGSMALPSLAEPG